MPAFLINLFWSLLISTITREFFGPEQEKGDQGPAALADIDAPTIDEGTAVPVVFGSVLSSRQNVSWYGGLASEPIVKQGITVGYKYSISAQCSLCVGPVDAIREIRFDDTVVPSDKVVWTSSDHYWEADINAPDLLGGVDKEGGVVGVIRIYKGTAAQPPDVELTTLVNAELPGYRRVCYAVLYSVYLGVSTRLKSPSFLIERLPTIPGLSSTYKVIGSHRDANPVCALYELMSEPFWGAAVPADQFDLPSWLAAAATVHGEGLGVSLTLSSPADLDSTTNNLLKYVDGVVYDDPTTGLIGIRLVREGDLVDAPLLTKDHVSEVRTSRVSWSELQSTVKVTYTDPSRNYETGGVMAQNSALVQSLGGAVTLETFDASAFTTAATAQFASERLLRALSYPMSKAEIVGDRTLATLQVGQPLRLQWSRPPIDAYYRVTQVTRGDSLDGNVTVSCVEDVFAAASNTFTPPPGSGWTAEGARALPVALALLMEAPYHLRRVDARTILFGAARPNTSHTGYYASVQGGADDTVYGWLASGVLSADLPQWDGPTLSSLALAMTLPADVGNPTTTEYDAGEALLLVGGELMAYRTVAVSGGTVTFGTVARGVLDTVPEAHSSGERVYVLKTARVRPVLDLASDASVTVAARTITQADVQPAEEATVRSLTTSSRALRPLPPGAPRVDGVLWDNGSHVEGAVLTWEPRSRMTAAVVAQDATGYTAEAGTDYVLRVYQSGALLATYTTSATSHTLTETGALTITLHARRGGLESHQGQRLTLTVTPAAGHLLLESGHLLRTESGDRLVLEA